MTDPFNSNPPGTGAPAYPVPGAEEIQRQMRDMGQEDIQLGQAMQAAPPNAVQPEAEIPLDDLGLEKFKIHMSPNGYRTFLCLVHWALLCQNIFEGKPLKWDEGTMQAMQSPFVGFGNPHLWEVTYTSNVARIIHAHYFNWATKGKRYQMENRLPHIIVDQMAAVFAHQGRGWQHSLYIQDLCADPESYKQI